MPPLNAFKLERYFARYEFKARYLLSPSDCEALTLTELLALANDEGRYFWDNLALGYTESPGHPALRQAVASTYQHILPDQVIIAAPEEAIYVAMNTLVDPGDHVVCVSPSYQSLYEIARARGCAISSWQVRPSAGRWHLDLDELEGLLTPATRLLVVNFPHNPTGYLPTLSELQAIVALARRHGLYIFCDEMYRHLEYDTAAQLPAIADSYERGISLAGLSKAFALPGLRIGWLASTDTQLPARWLAFKDYTTICNSAPSEILALIALQAARPILSRNLAIVSANIQAAAEFANRHDDLFEWYAPQAGSIAFPRWLGSLPLDELAYRLVDERGVMLVPGSIFDFPDSHFRIGLGRRNLPEALSQVDAFIDGERQ